MKIFLSWSGARSGAVAGVLKERLPDIVQDINIWRSSDDIPRGAGWFDAIADAAQQSDQAIVIVTPENQAAPWLNFEAGAFALGRGVGDERRLAVPWLVGLTDAQLSGPMSSLNCVTLSEATQVRQALTEMVDGAIAKRVEKMFDQFWPDIASEVESAFSTTAADEAVPEPRDEGDMVAEILSIVRELVPTTRGTRSLVQDSADVGDVYDEVALRPFTRALVRQLPPGSITVRRSRTKGGTRQVDLIGPSPGDVLDALEKVDRNVIPRDEPLEILVGGRSLVSFSQL